LLLLVTLLILLLLLAAPFQAGLSWSTILAKREAYRAAFEGFDPAKVRNLQNRPKHCLAGRMRVS
jgi:3-methyladenine DNA glycosylase Tag